MSASPAKDFAFETGDWDSLSGRAGVAMIAHWSPDGEVLHSTRELMNALQTRGYSVLLVSTCERRGPLHGAADHADAVIRRPNQGYDFGSWATAILAAPPGLLLGPVIIANDSLAGPFASLGPVLDHMEQSPALAWGLVASGQFGWHLQSFFVRFSAGVATRRPLMAFWRSIRQLDSKQRVILQYELGLSRLLYGEGFRLDSFIPVGLTCGRDQNPMMAGWRGVLDAGVPFVKRELLRNPDLVPDGHEVADEVADRYGVHLADWI